jgi:hypothetical protein
MMEMIQGILTGYLLNNNNTSLEYQYSKMDYPDRLAMIICPRTCNGGDAYTASLD